MLLPLRVSPYSRWCIIKAKCFLDMSQEYSLVGKNFPTTFLSVVK